MLPEMHENFPVNILILSSSLAPGPSVGTSGRVQCQEEVKAHPAWLGGGTEVMFRTDTMQVIFLLIYLKNFCFSSSVACLCCNGLGLKLFLFVIF